MKIYRKRFVPDEIIDISSDEIIFRDEDENVCYSYIPYYSIDKNVLKDIFIEIMQFIFGLLPLLISRCICT